MTSKRVTGRAVMFRSKASQTTKPMRVGIIGLGLMGQGIATCLLANGHVVVGFDNEHARFKETTAHARTAIAELKKQKLIAAEHYAGWKSRLEMVETMEGLRGCSLVIECVREDLDVKRGIFKELEGIVRRTTIIASNTSSLPISLLQKDRVAPQRYIGMHWGEPAQIMRYLEIIPGEKTSRKTTQAALKFGLACGKEPAVLKQDIRGFLSNRMMYAMLREACHLVESGVADVETVDQSFRNDMGWWALLAGPFRWMDLTGIPAYAAVMDGLLVKLSTQTETPKMMQQMVKRGAMGISNQKGFYKYTKASAAQWERDWVQFTYEMRQLADRYTPAKGTK